MIRKSQQADTKQQVETKREPLRELTQAINNEAIKGSTGNINQIIEEEREKNRKLLSEIKAMRSHYNK